MIVKIPFLTDIHFGNPKIQASRMVESLHEYAYPVIAESQLLLLGGDFFDRLLDINSDAGILAIYIIDELINLAIEKKIYIRVLRGTFSHDRMQNRMFTERAQHIPNYNGISLVRTVNKVEIERFPVFGLDILFCPDDQPQEDMTEAILETLNANHLEQVDYMCCHGYWDHLLPDNTVKKPHDCLDYDRLKNRVRYQIFNGHVHSPGIWKKVISGGSFERFRHGEEEDKGFYLAEYNSDTKTSAIKFIRNKKAVPFITIHMDNSASPESALEYLDKRVKQDLKYYDTTDEVIHVRIIGDGAAIVPMIKDKYKHVLITEKHVSTRQKVEVEFSDTISDLPTITVENLPSIIHANVKEEHPEMTESRIKEILDDTGI